MNVSGENSKEIFVLHSASLLGLLLHHVNNACAWCHLRITHMCQHQCRDTLSTIQFKIICIVLFKCQASVVCHVSPPHVSLFGLFPVLV